MGDLQTDEGESLELRYVPPEEFERLLAADVPAVARARAFAALARKLTMPSQPAEKPPAALSFLGSLMAR